MNYLCLRDISKSAMCVIDFIKDLIYQLVMDKVVLICFKFTYK